MEQSVLLWLSNNYIETIAASLGLLALYYQYKQNYLLWPVSIVVAALYTWVFIDSLLYAYALLQVYYFAVSIYGWYKWVNKNNYSVKGLIISYTSINLALKLLIIFVLGFLSMYYILVNYTQSDVPLLDSFISSLSFIATWMLANKKLEHWLIWIVVDSLSVFLYIYKGLYPSAIFFSILTIVAVAGYYKWKKEIQ